MTYRIIGIMLLATMLLAACGRRLPEEGVVSSSTGSTSESAVAAEPTETTTDESSEDETEVSATDDANDTTENETETDDATAEAGADDPIALAIAAGDTALGEQIFNQSYDTSVGPWICASCHSVTPDQLRLVGPGLWGLAETGEQRIAESGDESIPVYVYNSIIHPMDYIVPPDDAGVYPENLMPANYEELLTEDELNALVAYILTLNE